MLFTPWQKFEFVMQVGYSYKLSKLLMPPETHVSNRIAHPDFLIWNTAANG